MQTKQKVMVFIARPKGSSFEWLALRNNPDPKHGGDRWYVVTGNVEAEESLEQAAKREVWEETGIDLANQLIPLHISYTYQSDLHPGVNFEEHGFLLITDSPKEIVLNEEHIDSTWLDLDEFASKIWWTDSRKKLRLILETATNKIP